MYVGQYSYLRYKCWCGNYILHLCENIVYTFLSVALDIITCRPPSPTGEGLFMRYFKLLIDKKLKFLAFIQFSNLKLDIFPSLLLREKVARNATDEESKNKE